ncbi:hypothetical protein DSC_10035 [Pseudoxanthomonas spadix BD-a59]|uniref:Uncharacterized protein n=1 Tax=Pseudoxanthomonas spadix (strain BD-a59) TaxID=1045855 RepID=G7UNM7_PSEUP|nr:hypothetical protein DSC_10035 [Pseudoxanthomonas spadix BD-a59]
MLERLNIDFGRGRVLFFSFHRILQITYGIDEPIARCKIPIKIFWRFTFASVHSSLDLVVEHDACLTKSRPIQVQDESAGGELGFWTRLPLELRGEVYFATLPKSQQGDVQNIRGVQ